MAESSLIELQGEVTRLQRSLQLFTACNRALIRAESETDLLQIICQLMVELGGYRLAWVGYVRHNPAKTVEPVIHAGAGSEYLESIQITWDDTDLGQGPTGRAIRSGQPCLVQDINTEADYTPWRQLAKQQGYRGSIALPLNDHGEIFGTLNLYAPIANNFHPEEVQLLTQLAADLSYGVTALRANQIRQATEQALQQSYEQYNQLVNRIPVGVYKFRMSADGGTQFLYASPRWAEMNQLDPAAVLADADRAFGIVHPDDLDGFVQRNEQARTTLNPFVWEGRMVIGDVVRWRHIESVPTPQANGDIIWDGIQYDITDRKAAEAERLGAVQIRRELKLLEDILDIVLAGYWEWHIPNHHHYMSFGWKRMLGYEDDELPTRPETWKELIFSEDLPVVMGHFEQHVQSHGEVPYYNEVRYRHKNGSTVWLICSGRVIEWDAVGNPVRMIGCHIDISDRKQTEAQLQRVNQELQRSNQELEQFAYITSHDLQEPLRAIIGYTQLLDQNYRDVLNEPAAQESLGFIIDGGQRMRQLIQDLLAYSRVGSQPLRRVPIDMNIVLVEVLQNLTVTIDEAQAVITSDDLPMLLIDKTQLMQLLQNLISNAIKFRGKAPPQIHISAMPLFIPTAIYTQADRATAYQFSIADNGIGIKPQYLTQIFEIFRRLHPRSRFPGTGIGLAISKKIVGRHGGEIWATSDWGQGTTFFFTLSANLNENSQQ
jgi:PAS domain S-box-containing protein